MASTYQLDPTNQLGHTINAWQSHAQTVIAPATANTENLIASRKDTLILYQNQYCRGLSANACATQMLQNEATAKAIKELAYMAVMMSPVGVLDSAKTVATGTDLSGEDSSRLLAVLGVLGVNEIKAISHAVAETGGLLKAAKAAVSDSPEANQLTKELEDVNKAGIITANRLPVPDDLPSSIHAGAQDKHILGTNNYIEGRSYLIDGVDANDLLSGVHSGQYPVVGTGSRGNPVVDFGQPIGVSLPSGTPTQYGQIHYGKNGAHIVPHDPSQVQ